MKKEPLKLTFRIDPNLHQELKEESLKQGWTTLNSWFNDIVERFIDESRLERGAPLKRAKPYLKRKF